MGLSMNRKEKIAWISARWGTMTRREMAVALGVTRQNVFEIAKTAGLIETAARPEPGFGPKAYHVRKMTRKAWGDIADMLGYRPEDKRRRRAQMVMRLAKDYADAHGFAWPLKGEKTNG